MNNDVLRLEDLVNNPTARVPICLCLDVSGSMDGAPIQELNQGIRIVLRRNSGGRDSPLCR